MGPLTKHISSYLTEQRSQKSAHHVSGAATQVPEGLTHRGSSREGTECGKERSQSWLSGLQYGAWEKSRAPGKSRLASGLETGGDVTVKK